MTPIYVLAADIDVNDVDADNDIGVDNDIDILNVMLLMIVALLFFDHPWCETSLQCFLFPKKKKLSIEWALYACKSLL